MIVYCGMHNCDLQIATNKTRNEEKSMAKYGRHLGTAFQLIDDVLDYSSSENELGKNIGKDLSHGNPTLPLLYALWNGAKDQKKNTARMQQFLENNTLPASWFLQRKNKSF